MLFFSCSDSSQHLEKQSVLKNNCSNNNKCLKLRHLKIIFTSLCVKISISSSFSPICFFCFCHMLYHERKKNLHAQINATLCLDFEYHSLHTMRTSQNSLRKQLFFLYLQAASMKKGRMQLLWEYTTTYLIWLINSKGCRIKKDMYCRRVWDISHHQYKELQVHSIGAFYIHYPT